MTDHSTLGSNQYKQEWKNYLEVNYFLELFKTCLFLWIRWNFGIEKYNFTKVLLIHKGNTLKFKNLFSFFLNTFCV